MKEDKIISVVCSRWRRQNKEPSPITIQLHVSVQLLGANSNNNIISQCFILWRSTKDRLNGKNEQKDRKAILDTEDRMCEHVAMPNATTNVHNLSVLILSRLGNYSAHFAWIITLPDPIYHKFMIYPTPIHFQPLHSRFQLSSYSPEFQCEF